MRPHNNHAGSGPTNQPIMFIRQEYQGSASFAMLQLFALAHACASSKKVRAEIYPTIILGKQTHSKNVEKDATEGFRKTTFG